MVELEPAVVLVLEVAVDGGWWCVEAEVDAIAVDVLME